MIINEKINARTLEHESNVIGSQFENIDESEAHGAELLDTLYKLSSHQLADLDKANLMDRVDVKFMLPIATMPSLLKQLQPHYSVLEIDGNRISRYYNHYFDTESMNFYHDHHNGKLNRFKVRQRTYLDTNTKFLEVKFKNNQKRTIKSRINCNASVTTDEKCSDFIYQEMGTSFDQLSISQQSGYQRIALANEASAERLTLDFNLWYQLDDESQKVRLPGFFIAELKQRKRTKMSPFFQLMSKNHIFPASFSKYCIGCALLYKNAIKTNKFKAVLSQVEKFSLSNRNPLYLSN